MPSRFFLSNSSENVAILSCASGPNHARDRPHRRKIASCAPGLRSRYWSLLRRRRGSDLQIATREAARVAIRRSLPQFLAAPFLNCAPGNVQTPESAKRTSAGVERSGTPGYEKTKQARAREADDRPCGVIQWLSPAAASWGYDLPHFLGSGFASTPGFMLSSASRTAQPFMARGRTETDGKSRRDGRMANLGVSVVPPGLRPHCVPSQR